MYPGDKDIMTIFRLIIVFSFNMSKNDGFSRKVGEQGNLIARHSLANFIPKVENKGVEPLTPCVQGRCSGQLS